MKIWPRLTPVPILLFLALDISARSPASKQELIQRTPRQQQSERQAGRQISFKVIATDAAGKFAGALKEQSFTILDNGKPQPVTGFKAICGGGSQPPDRVVFLIDTMNNTFDNVAFERKGIAEYLQQNGGRLAQPTSLVMFSDYGVKVGENASDGSILIKDLKKLSTPIHENAGAEGGEGVMRRFTASVRAITKLVDYESTLPGRLTLLWFGPGWPMLESANISAGSDKDKQGYFSAIIDLTNHLRAGRITIDVIAPSALVSGSTQRTDYYKQFLGPVHSSREADSGNLALPVLAIHSGGQVVKFGDSLPSEIAACLASAQSYYVLSYQAPPAGRQDEYHAITVTTPDPTLSLRTLSGYYAAP